MRVAFFGKGGSGKTTFTAGFTKYLQNKENKFVLAVDADHNKHLGDLLDIEGFDIGTKEEEITQYLKGKREIKHFVATTPPSYEHNFIRLNNEDTFLKMYSTQKNNTSLITIGGYDKEDKGATCYHGKLDVLSYVMNHLLDDKDEFVVVDSTAGVDLYGSSLVTAYDVNVVIVEPTMKSVNVYKEFYNLMKDFHSDIIVVTNKIEDQDDLDFIKQHIPEDKIVGVSYKNSSIKKVDQGNIQAFNDFVKLNEELFEKIYVHSKNKGKNWDGYLENLKEIHISGAKAWWDTFYNDDISGQADIEFNYENKLEELKNE